MFFQLEPTFAAAVPKKDVGKHISSIETLAKALHKEFIVYHYSETDPVFILDFASNLDGYYRFLDGTNLESIGTSIQQHYPAPSLLHTASVPPTRRYSMPCIVRSDYELSIVQITGLYLAPSGDDDIRMLYSCSDIKLIRKYTDHIPLALSEAPCQYESPAFFFGRIAEVNTKEAVYSACHNLFFVGDRMYLSADVTLETYPATYVADYLSAMTRYLQMASKNKALVPNVKINIHSPGYIYLAVNSAALSCAEWWPALLLLAVIVFGGKIITEKATVESPSLRSFIEFIATWEHVRNMEKETLNQAKQKTKSMKLDNELKELEIEARRKELQSHAQALSDAAQKLKISPANDNATDLRKVMSYFIQQVPDDPSDTATP